ncbi:hypothetical protein PanWU01x14_102360, partial [Parasponia andersonii]
MPLLVLTSPSSSYVRIPPPPLSSHFPPSPPLPHPPTTVVLPYFRLSLPSYSLLMTYTPPPPAASGEPTPGHKKLECILWYFIKPTVFDSL